MNGWRGAVTLVVLGLCGVAGAVFASPRVVEQPPVALDVPEVVAPPAPITSVRREVTKQGELAGTRLRSMGAPTDEILAGAGSFLNRVLIGDTFVLDTRAGDTRPFRLRLIGGPNRDQAMTNEFVWNGKKYVSRQVPVPYRVEAMAAAVTVTSSLWAAATRVGFSPPQIENLARIFEYDVDFNTELAEGARFRMVLDRLTADDGAQRVGDIRAAILDNGSKTYTAIRYRLSDGSIGWYAPDGTARKKAFLRSPLEFSRVTSGFTTGRYHPVLHKMRAHKGVDLAAPSGTPIRAASDGTVSRAGWAGGHGNHVELKHAGGYATGYSHMSKIAVKAGGSVRQGQVIGYVGSTGLSTGPHLHYEFILNGVHKDPMKSIVPIAQPLPEAEKGAFFAIRDAVLPTLESATELKGAEESEGTGSTSTEGDR